MLGALQSAALGVFLASRPHALYATYAATASVGPGATNMLTGAALATTNRLPALLLPSDTFATRTADPVLQQLEQPGDTGLTVNDAFRPVVRYWDRITRPSQITSPVFGVIGRVRFTLNSTVV